MAAKPQGSGQAGAAGGGADLWEQQRLVLRTVSCGLRYGSRASLALHVVRAVYKALWLQLYWECTENRGPSVRVQ